MIEAVLFDIDGTLITTGGAGAVAWQHAFEELHGTPLDIGEVTESGMTDPEVAASSSATCSAAIPAAASGRRRWPTTCATSPASIDASDGYEVMPGIEELLERLIDDGHLLGLITGNIEAAAHIKLARAGLNRFFSFGGYGSDSNERTEVTEACPRAGRARLRRRPRSSRRLHLGRRHPPRRRRRPRRRHQVVGVATGNFTVEQLSEAAPTTLRRVDPASGLRARHCPRRSRCSRADD